MVEGLGSSGASEKSYQTEPLPRKTNSSQAPEKDARDFRIGRQAFCFGNGAELLGGFCLFSGGAMVNKHSTDKKGPRLKMCFFLQKIGGIFQCQVCLTRV